MCTMTQDWARRLAAIKPERERRGLTQAELAGLAGVAESTVQNLEGSRQYNSEPRSLRRVEAALHVSAVEEPEEAIALPAEPAPAATTLRGGMPLRVQHELSAGEVVDTEIINLSRGGMKMVVVLTREPDDDSPDEDRMRQDMQEWTRIQRKLRHIAAEDEDDSAVTG